MAPVNFDPIRLMFQAEVNKALTDTRRFEKGVNDSFSSLGRNAQQTGKSFRFAETGLSRLTDRLRVFQGNNYQNVFRGITASIAGFVSQSVVAGTNLQRLQQNFETLIGSQARSKKLFDDIIQFSAVTPFQFPDLANAARQLLAFNTGVENINKNLRILGDVSLGNTERLGRLIYAYGQVYTAQRLNAQELRQFTEAGLPLIQELARLRETSPRQIREQISANQLGPQDLQDALESLTSQGGLFFNALSDAAETLSGRLATLVDNITIFKVELADDLLPVFTSLTEGGIALVKAIAPLADFTFPALFAVLVALRSIDFNKLSALIRARATIPQLSVVGAQVAQGQISKAAQSADFLQKRVDRLRGQIATVGGQADGTFRDPASGRFRQPTAVDTRLQNQLKNAEQRVRQATTANATAIRTFNTHLNNTNTGFRSLTSRMRIFGRGLLGVVGLNVGVAAATAGLLALAQIAGTIKRQNEEQSNAYLAAIRATHGYSQETMEAQLQAEREARFRELNSDELNRQFLAFSQLTKSLETLADVADVTTTRGFFAKVEDAITDFLVKAGTPPATGLRPIEDTQVASAEERRVVRAAHDAEIEISIAEARRLIEDNLNALVFAETEAAVAVEKIVELFGTDLVTVLTEAGHVTVSLAESFENLDPTRLLELVDASRRFAASAQTEQTRRENQQQPRVDFLQSARDNANTVRAQLETLDRLQAVGIFTGPDADVSVLEKKASAVTGALKRITQSWLETNQTLRDNDATRFLITEAEAFEFFAPLIQQANLFKAQIDALDTNKFDELVNGFERSSAVLGRLFGAEAISRFELGEELQSTLTRFVREATGALYDLGLTAEEAAERLKPFTDRLAVFESIDFRVTQLLEETIEGLAVDYEAIRVAITRSSGDVRNALEEQLAVVDLNAAANVRYREVTEDQIGVTREQIINIMVLNRLIKNNTGSYDELIEQQRELIYGSDSYVATLRRVREGLEVNELGIILITNAFKRGTVSQAEFEAVTAEFGRSAENVISLIPKLRTLQDSTVGTSFASVRALAQSTDILSEIASQTGLDVDLVSAYLREAGIESSKVADLFKSELEKQLSQRTVVAQLLFQINPNVSTDFLDTVDQTVADATQVFNSLSGVANSAFDLFIGNMRNALSLLQQELQLAQETFAGVKEELNEEFRLVSELYARQYEEGLIRAEEFEAKIDELQAQRHSKLRTAEQRKIELQRETAKKQYDIEIAQFTFNKVRSIADAIINTALGVTRALSLANPVLAGIIGGLGAVQVGIIAAQSPPPPPALQTGGIVTGRTLAELGEGGQPEVIFPLDRLNQFINERDDVPASRPVVNNNTYIIEGNVFAEDELVEKLRVSVVGSA